MAESNGWEGFGKGAGRTRWYQQLNMVDLKNRGGLAVECRVVTQPFFYSTHWYFKLVEDAWLHKNDRDALKEKYNGDARKAMRFAHECPDIDHVTGKRIADVTCLHDTTYSDYERYADRTALVQVFYRIPKAQDPALRLWSKDLYVLQMNDSVIKGLGRVIDAQGSHIAHPKEGYSIYITYNKGQGANTWAVDFPKQQNGTSTPLTKEQWDVVKAQRLNFNEIYEPTPVEEIEKDLRRLNYDKLLDGTLDDNGGVLPKPGTARAGASRTAPARTAPGRRAPAAPAEDDYTLEDEPALPGDEFSDAELAGEDAETYGDETFGDEAPLDDFPEDGIEDAPPPPPARRPAAPARAAAPARPAAPPARAAAPQRPVAPPARSAAPARPNTPQRPGAPRR